MHQHQAGLFEFSWYCCLAKYLLPVWRFASGPQLDCGIKAGIFLIITDNVSQQFFPVLSGLKNGAVFIITIVQNYYVIIAHGHFLRHWDYWDHN